jgi:hypothetical protein
MAYSDQTLMLGVYNHPLTLSDVADDATGDRIHSDPNSLFVAFLTIDGTRVLDRGLLLQKYLKRTARSVCPEEAAKSHSGHPELNKKRALREASVVPEVDCVRRRGYGRCITLLMGATRNSLVVIGKRGVSYRTKLGHGLVDSRVAYL